MLTVWKSSLDSLSTLQLGDDARHFLRTIAFRPQGVDEKKLKDLFPMVREVDLLAAALRRHFLLYIDGERTTMLSTGVDLKILCSWMSGPITITGLKSSRTANQGRKEALGL
jgi:hypothetical protein